MPYYYQLQETQWWTHEQLNEMQNSKLRKLVRHCYENVPYYRRIFNERGLRVEDIKTTDDLAKIPVLNKDIIRDNFDDLQARNRKQWRPVSDKTGGSTGKPLEYFITKDAASINWAGIYRGWGWAGYEIGDKRATVAGSSMVVVRPLDVVSRLRLMVDRNLPISTLEMTEERLQFFP